MSGIATCTVTGKIGPGNTLTSTVLNNVTQFTFDPVNCRFIYVINDISNTIDISARTTVTVTLSAAAGNYTVTVS
jgi:hypothetical protein